MTLFVLTSGDNARWWLSAIIGKILLRQFNTRVSYKWVVLYSCTDLKKEKNNCGFTHGNCSKMECQAKKEIKKKNQTDCRSIDDWRHTFVGPSRMIRGLWKLSPKPHTIVYTARYPLPTTAAVSHSSTLSPVFIVTKYTRYNYYCNSTAVCVFKRRRDWQLPEITIVPALCAWSSTRPDWTKGRTVWRQRR